MRQSLLLIVLLLSAVIVVMTRGPSPDEFAKRLQHEIDQLPRPQGKPDVAEYHIESHNPYVVWAADVTGSHCDDLKGSIRHAEYRKPIFHRNWSEIFETIVDKGLYDWAREIESAKIKITMLRENWSRDAAPKKKFLCFPNVKNVSEYLKPQKGNVIFERVELENGPVIFEFEAAIHPERDARKGGAGPEGAKRVGSGYLKVKGISDCYKAKNEFCADVEVYTSSGQLDSNLSGKFRVFCWKCDNLKTPDDLQKSLKYAGVPFRYHYGEYSLENGIMAPDFNFSVASRASRRPLPEYYLQEALVKFRQLREVGEKNNTELLPLQIEDDAKP